MGEAERARAEEREAVERVRQVEAISNMVEPYRTVTYRDTAALFRADLRTLLAIADRSEAAYQAGIEDAAREVKRIADLANAAEIIKFFGAEEADRVVLAGIAYAAAIRALATPRA